MNTITMNIVTMSDGTGALSRLLWLASPGLPIGAYAYSRGLEQAVERGLVCDAATLEGWIEGVLTQQLASLDAPVMVRVLRAVVAGDFDAVLGWNEFLCACRESGEFALEDAQLGGSLARLLGELGVESASRLSREVGGRPGHAAVFGLACAHFGVAQEASVAGYLLSFVENQVIAALKCLQLGQTAGQRVLSALITRVDALVGSVLARPDAQLGSFAPGLAMVSALHETQYTRLFRS